MTARAGAKRVDAKMAAALRAMAGLPAQVVAQELGVSLRTVFKYRALDKSIDIPITFEEPEPRNAMPPPPLPPSILPGPFRLTEPVADRSWVDRPVEDDFFWAPSPEGERILLVPDTHAPYHDKRAWAAMMGFAKAFKPSVIVHVGDWVDCYTISDYEKDPRRGSALEDEIKATQALREELDALNPRLKVVTLGNHETRLYRHLVRNSPALIGLMTIEELLGLPQAGWRVVPYERHGAIGKLNVTHDTNRSGVNAVRQTALDFCASVAFGHSHRLATYYFGDVLGQKHVSANLGWLGDASKIDYCHRVVAKDWQHGFGTCIMDRDGLFELQVKPIVGGRVISLP